MQPPIFTDRTEAGRSLGELLGDYADQTPTVLAIPRGGVVVGAGVAQALHAPLDLVIARKIGAPGQPELAIGAVVSDRPGQLLDEQAISHLRVPQAYIEHEAARQHAEITRQLDLYREGRPATSVSNRVVLVVDDGIATGYTMRAALVGLRAQSPRQLVVAVPVAPPCAQDELAGYLDEFICLASPEPFLAVGVWYHQFEQTTDEQVRRLLALAEQRLTGERQSV